MNNLLKQKASKATRVLGRLIKELSSLDQDSSVSTDTATELKRVVDKCQITRRLVVYKLRQLKQLGGINESTENVVKKLLSISKSELYKEIQRANYEIKLHDGDESYIGYFSNSSFLDAVHILSRYCKDPDLVKIVHGAQEKVGDAKNVSFQDLCIYVEEHYPHLLRYISKKDLEKTKRQMSVADESSTGDAQSDSSDSEESTSETTDSQITEPYEDEAILKRTDPDSFASSATPTSAKTKFESTGPIFKHQTLDKSWVCHLIQQHEKEPKIMRGVIATEVSKLDEPHLIVLEKVLVNVVGLVKAELQREEKLANLVCTDEKIPDDEASISKAIRAKSQRSRRSWYGRISRKRFNAFNAEFLKYDGEEPFVRHLSKCINQALKPKQRAHLLEKLGS